METRLNPLTTVRVRVTLRLGVYRESVRLGVKPLWDPRPEIFFFQMISCGNIPETEYLYCCTEYEDAPCSLVDGYWDVDGLYCCRLQGGSLICRDQCFAEIYDSFIRIEELSLKTERQYLYTRLYGITFQNYRAHNSEYREKLDIVSFHVLAKHWFWMELFPHSHTADELFAKTCHKRLW
jgi:hypothetical protein